MTWSYLRLVVLLTVPVLIVCGQYSVSTVAGGGPANGLSATSIALSFVNGVAVDGAGNLYIASTTQDRVYKAAPNGSIIIVAGNGTAGYSGDNGPAASAQLNSPNGVAIDASGNLYIADSNNNRVRKVSGGVITTVAGNGTCCYSGDGGPATSAQINNVYGIALDSAGNLYIADRWNSRIRKVSGGVITTVAGNGFFGYSGDGGPATSAQISSPWGIAVDNAGNFYFADIDNFRIRKVSGGVITTVAGNGTGGSAGDGGPATSAQIGYAQAVAVDNLGNLYIADGGRIRKVSGGLISTVAGGGCCELGDFGPPLSALINGASAVAVDGSGNLYIADSGHYRVREVTPGLIFTVAGNGSFEYYGDSGPATSAQLDPGGLAADNAGNLFIADSRDYRVRKVSGGAISTVAGNGAFGYSGDNGPAASAQIGFPRGIAADNNGNLYIADVDNARIRRVSGGLITTVAGNGTFGYAGDGGLATDGHLNSPQGIAVDGSGTLYIADTGSQRIRKVAAGVISTVAGGGPPDGAAATGTSIEPGGTAVDSAGNLYVSSRTHNRVYKVSTNGTISTVAGNGSYGYSGDGGPATSAQLSYPTSVAVDGAGSLYIADTNNSRIRKLSGGVITTVAGNGIPGYSGDNGPPAGAQLSYPTGVAVDGAGNLYIADRNNSRIRKVSAGLITTVAGNGIPGYSGDLGPAVNAQLNYPNAVAADSAGNLYISDFNNQRIRKIEGEVITTVAGNGTFGYFGDGGPATSAQINYPEALAVDDAGNLYIADNNNNRIRKVAGGLISTVAGNGAAGFSGDGGLATNASISFPGGVAMDSAGNLYIADGGNYRIRKVTGGGITTVAGNGSYSFSGDGGPATGAQLGNPSAVAVDSSGNLYIADSGNGRVRVVSSGGTITTFAGGGNQFPGDGGPATAAALSPHGIAVDSSQNVYLLDSNRLRKVSAGLITTITTVAGNGSYPFAGDGGVAVDSTGKIYVSDVSSGRVLLVISGSVTSLSPTFALAGAAGFTLTINGSSFVNGDTVFWNGTVLNTTFVNSSQLTAAVTSIQIAQAGPASVAVMTPNGLTNALTFQVLLPPPATNLTSSVNPSILGQAVTLSATVTPSTATGRVTFYDGTTILGSRALVGGQATLSTTLLPSGPRSLKAYYSGDFLYSASVSPMLVQTVTALPQAGFASPLTYATGGGPASIAIGDFNGDGKADLAVANTTSDNVSILLGNGDGTFQPAGSYVTGGFPYSIAAGDFNADGNIDLAVVNANSNTLSVLFGNGNGTFQPALNIAAGTSPKAVTVGDFNGDGRTDLAVTNDVQPNGSVSVLLGNGDGSFQAVAEYQVGNDPIFISAGDFNGDGRSDLVVANYSNGTVSVLLGNGNGTFQGAVNYGAAFNARSVAVGDLNGDGKLDLAVTNWVGANLGVLLGNGNGTFQPAVMYPAGSLPGSVVIADFTGDGKYDLAVTNSSSNNVGILRGNGDGTFQPPVNYAAGGGYSFSMATGDFNGDGRSDLAVANYNSNTVSILLGASPPLGVALTHTGNFIRGQNGATYSVLVVNQSGAPPTSGTVVLTENLPPSLTLVSMAGVAGDGWTCAGNVCSRSDALAGGASYPPITVTVNVATNAPAMVINQVILSGAGDAIANDPTTILAAGPASVTPGSGAGFIQTFAFSYVDSLGAADFRQEWVWFTPAFGNSAANSCMLYYENATNLLRLLNDAGTAWMQGTRGSSGTLQNSQCSLNLSSTEVAVSGNNLTISVPLVFTTVFAGVNQVWMYASGSTANSGWQHMGNWRVPAGPTAVAVTPNSGSGAAQTFAFLYSDLDGATDLRQEWVWFTPAFGASAANSCMFYYENATNLLRLLNDAGTAWMPVTVGTNAILQNSQCSFSLSGVTVTNNGNNQTISIPLTFKAPFAGLKQVWMYALGSGVNSGWQQRGTWNVVFAQLTSISPAAAPQNSDVFTMTANGSNFVSGASLQWTAPTGPTVSLPADFINAAQLQATIPANLLTTAGTAQVAVLSGGLVTASFPFKITGAPQLNSISPNAVLMNSGAFNMTANGGDFFAGAGLRWTAPGGLSATTLPANFINAAQLQATVPNSLLATPGVAQVAVQNPGGLLSPAKQFAIIPTPVSVVSAAPNNGNGSSQTFQFQYADIQGAADWRQQWIWFTAAFGNGAANSCMFYYEQATNLMKLLNDAGSAFSLAGTPGANGVLQNSQCSISLSSMTVTPAGNLLTLSVPLTFTPAFAGIRQMWLYGLGSVSNSGWQLMGNWTVSSGPAALSVTPNSGSGAVQTFQFLYSDGAGAADLRQEWVWFTNAFGGNAASSCMLYYEQTSNLLRLINDAGTAWLSGTPATAGTLQNSQCGINLSTTTVIASGNNLTLSVPLTFTPAFTGAKQVWMYALGNAGNSGWQQRGAWTSN